MNRPWKKPASSFPSDRLNPAAKNPPNNAGGPKNKGKGKQQIQQPPKSKQVRRLEDTLRDIQSGNGGEKDEKGGCFCLARTHELSPYIPICFACGLIRCSVNPPQCCCPYCGTILMTPSVRQSLVDRLESEIASQIAKEVEEKEKSEEEARMAAGAFPQLQALRYSPSPSPSPVPSGRRGTTPAQTQPQTHKVMSLTGTNKRVIVSSYTSTPAHSHSPSPANEDAEEKEPVRVPRPSPEPEYSQKQRDPNRPWENFIDGATYVSRPRLDEQDAADYLPNETQGGSSNRRKRRNKAKEKEASERA